MTCTVTCLEVCDCNTLCPCWIGEDPDNGTCQSALAYRIEAGEIDGVDVSGLTLALAAFIPGNVLEGNFRVVRYVDDRATPAQEEALLQAFRGELGGPLADLAALVGEEVAARRAADHLHRERGPGHARIGDGVDAEMEPYRGPTGEPTRLVESIFSTIPGSPAYVGKASRFTLRPARARHRPRSRRPQRDPGPLRAAGLTAGRCVMAARCGATPATSHDRLFVPLFVGLPRSAGAPWPLGCLALRPLSRPLTGPASAWPAALRRPAGRRGAGAGVALVLGWVVMTAAMMLPTTLPLVGLFRRLIRQPHRRRALTPAAARRLSRRLARLRPRRPPAGPRPAGPGAAVGMAHLQWLADRRRGPAGGRASSSSRRSSTAASRPAVRRCRFIAAAGRAGGQAGERSGWASAHGVYCVGCCWPLMLLMFVGRHRQHRLDAGAGRASWRWRRTARGASTLAAPLGVALVAVALGVAVHGATALAGLVAPRRLA